MRDSVKRIEGGIHEWESSESLIGYAMLLLESLIGYAMFRKKLLNFLIFPSSCHSEYQTVVKFARKRFSTACNGYDRVS